MSGPPESWTPLQSDQQKYYQLPLPRENVHFVETLDEVEQCRETVLKVTLCYCTLKTSVMIGLPLGIDVVCIFTFILIRLFLKNKEDPVLH